MNELEKFVKTMVLVLGFGILVILFPILANGLGETPYTFENLKRDCTTPRQLEQWLQANLVSRDFANDDRNSKERFVSLETGVADCDDYAELTYYWLKAHPYYSPIRVCFYRQGTGHVVTLYWDKGWKMFNNAKIVRIMDGVTYQDLAYLYDRNWTMITVFTPSNGKKTITRSDRLIRVGR